MIAPKAGQARFEHPVPVQYAPAWTGTDDRRHLHGDLLLCQQDHLPRGRGQEGITGCARNSVHFIFIKLIQYLQEKRQMNKKGEFIIWRSSIGYGYLSVSH